MQTIEFNHLPQLAQCSVCHAEYWLTQHWYHERECNLGPLTTEMVKKARYMPINHAIQVGGTRLVDTTLVVTPPEELVVTPELPNDGTTKHGKYKDTEKRKEYMRNYRKNKNAAAN